MEGKEIKETMQASFPQLRNVNFKLKGLTNSGDKKCFDPVSQQLKKNVLRQS